MRLLSTGVKPFFRNCMKCGCFHKFLLCPDQPFQPMDRIFRVGLNGFLLSFDISLAAKAR